MDKTPGLISLYAIEALNNIAREKDIKFSSHAELAKKLKLRRIRITEVDTQETDLEVDKQTFLNTWSSLGMEAEATDAVMMGWGTHEEKTDEIILPTDGKDKNVAFLAQRGMDVVEECITLDPVGNIINYLGYLLPHAEANTLSWFLNTEDDSYRPTVYYVYSPSPPAIESLAKLRDNDYKPLDNWYVLEQPDIINGEFAFDSIGVLLDFEDGTKYWSGTILSLPQVQEYGFIRSTPTTVQVATAINSAIKYFLKHKKLGTIDPEDLPLEILEDAKKYLGTFISTWIE